MYFRSAKCKKANHIYTIKFNYTFVQRSTVITSITHNKYNATKFVYVNISREKIMLNIYKNNFFKSCYIYLNSFSNILKVRKTHEAIRFIDIF